MLISELTKNTDCRIIGSDCDISRIEYDSRKLTGGAVSCFAASAALSKTDTNLPKVQLPAAQPHSLLNGSFLFPCRRLL